MPEAALRVVAPDVGGGFGPKFVTFPEEVVVAALARAIGRPVRWIEATKSRYISELSTQQKLRFLARLSGRAVDLKKEIND